MVSVALVGWGIGVWVVLEVLREGSSEHAPDVGPAPAAGVQRRDVALAGDQDLDERRFPLDLLAGAARIADERLHRRAASSARAASRLVLASVDEPACPMTSGAPCMGPRTC